LIERVVIGLIIAATLLVAVSVVGANTIESPVYTIHNLYIVYDYGNLVIAAINRSALTYLGNGYWLLVLPNMDAVTFSSELVNEVIGKFIGPRAFYSKLHITMTVDGYRTVKTINILNASDAPNDKIMNAIMQMLNISRAREALVWFLEGKVIRINVVTENGIDVEKIAKELSGIAMSHKVVVIETMGFGIPSYFDARDLYENLKKISCFVSVGESFYGVDIWFNISCIKELAIATNRSFNEAVEDVANSVKALDPLIRKYLPYQNIVVLVAQPPSPAIPLPGEPKPVERIEHTEAVEMSQTPPDLPQQILIISAIVVAVAITLALWRIRSMKKSFLYDYTSRYRVSRTTVLVRVFNSFSNTAHHLLVPLRPLAVDSRVLRK